MRSATDIASELDEGLKQLFDGGLVLALQVQADAMAAEPAERARLALSFHRLSRGIRQTAALRMKLAREAERSGRETTAEVISLDRRRLEKRKGQVKAAIQNLIWTEAEPDDSTFNLDLEELLDIETQDPETFQAEDLEDQVQRFAIMLGLQITAHPREGGDPSRGSAPRSADDPGPAWIPAFAGTSGGEGASTQTPTPVIPRSGDPPGPGDPSRPADPDAPLGSPASPCGRAEDDGEDEDPILSDDYWRRSSA